MRSTLEPGLILKEIFVNSRAGFSEVDLKVGVKIMSYSSEPEAVLASFRALLEPSATTVEVPT